jgi:hypothetical protein
MLGNSTTGYEGWLSWWEELNRAQTLSKERAMSNQPVGNTNGIFSLFFREAGLFWEQAFRGGGGGGGGGAGPAGRRRRPACSSRRVWPGRPAWTWTRC